MVPTSYKDDDDEEEEVEMAPKNNENNNNSYNIVSNSESDDEENIFDEDVGNEVELTPEITVNAKVVQAMKKL